MTHIDPDWQSTDDSPEEENVVVHEVTSPKSVNAGVQGSVQPQRVKIKRKNVNNLAVGMTGIIAIGLIFAQGVTYITANLTFDDSDQDAGTGAVIESELNMDDLPPIPNLGDIIREDKADTGTGADKKVDPVPANSNVKPQVTNEPHVNVQPSQPAVIQNQPPVVPAQNTGPAPTINLNQAVTEVAPAKSVWPSMLKINRFTVGSGLVPSFSPLDQMPIQIARETQQQAHMAASRPSGVSPMVTRQPATGPALGLVGLFSLLGVPLFLRKK
ncbi:hypothetical protein HOF56_02925 [Candidatus Peribacteria bacterium]|jgi:hypothetical protein|nr:hypothetical protein [Candidatus Peribacteria bacterium]MBT4020898.1 hypothetical protein [Candidatus Peribacteria bacterium]MBT4240614.1 hypothetical protein [Candidatus Peribacteria bacterium]MBT4474620.1 hypothetical protein [Candidatus Peribacteria bacterium]